MANKAAAVPDAWDDDWEAQADAEEEGGVKLSQLQEEHKLSKAEILARHKEENKKMWQSAEAPEPFHFLAAKDTVPLKTEFKPALKVLSRKPATADLLDGEEEEDAAKIKLSIEEMRAKTQREREEKQRKYDEARARLFGTEPKSGSSSPGHVTPPGQAGDGRGSGGRGRGRGRGGAARGQQQQQQQQGQDIRRPDSGGGQRELFDPNTAKPGSITIARRTNESMSSGRSTPNSLHDGQVLRAPKGPDATGRGGFGFANRGGKAG